MKRKENRKRKEVGENFSRRRKRKQKDFDTKSDVLGIPG